MDTQAAALAFWTFLGVFPFAALIVALTSWLGMPDVVGWLLASAECGLPSEMSSLARRINAELRDWREGGFLFVGVVAAVWSASSAVRQLMEALNLAYGVPKARPARTRYPLSLAFTLGFAVLMIVMTAAVLVGTRSAAWIADLFALDRDLVAWWGWLRWPLAAASMVWTVAGIYWVAPNLDRTFRIVSSGSLVAVAAWMIGSIAFSYYLTNLYRHGTAYGSVGTIVVLLLYLFVCSSALLFGAEVDAELLEAQSRNNGTSSAE